MANKKLKVGAAELKLPEKKVKGEKKPKWQAKTGGSKNKKTIAETPEIVVETEPTLQPEPTDAATVATNLDTGTVESKTDSVAANTHEESAVSAPNSEEPAAKKPRKLKVKADAPPKKLSMMAAALQVLQERKVAMTCPELIDVMATEGLWTSPGGKTPANTLYAAISRDIKDKGKASAFRKAERGRFEAKIK
ncbi:MAG: winged helix-turn-helix domain-containing protein [Planctomycetia bacterium]|nr:winged helix-turn-helix domain-containing protein [Planctomycetia bacterium]